MKKSILLISIGIVLGGIATAVLYERHYPFLVGGYSRMGVDVEDIDLRISRKDQLQYSSSEISFDDDIVEMRLYSRDLLEGSFKGHTVSCECIERDAEGRELSVSLENVTTLQGK